MKKNLLTVSVMLLLFSISTVLGARLFTWAPNTYVDSSHPTIDRYDGVVSVKGTDWAASNGYFRYPCWTRLTYNVQGQVTVLEVKSLGQSDANARVQKKSVYDQWNFGSETTAQYNYETKQAETDLRPQSLVINKK